MSTISLFGNALGRWIDLVLLIGILVPISIVDIRERKIPDIFVFLGLVLFLISKIFINNDISFWVILDTAVAFSSIVALRFITKDGIGMGDAKLSGLLGFLLGIYFWVVALLVASLAGLVAGGMLLLMKKIQRKEGIPFAPFLAIGAIVSYIFKYFIIKDVAGVWQCVLGYPK
jgi:prepilin signal peptidase PulO-like enzyme (type II secretory pathway)